MPNTTAMKEDFFGSHGQTHLGDVRRRIGQHEGAQSCYEDITRHLSQRADRQSSSMWPMHCGRLQFSKEGVETERAEHSGATLANSTNHSPLMLALPNFESCRWTDNK